MAELIATSPAPGASAGAVTTAPAPAQESPAGGSYLNEVRTR
jgi:hypothetical protein